MCEACATRTLQKPAILHSLATLIKNVVVGEMKSVLDMNMEVILKLESALQERDMRIADLEKQLNAKQDNLE